MKTNNMEHENESPEPAAVNENVDPYNPFRFHGFYTPDWSEDHEE
jgi:hypothetical protein